jgi:hypothetical protein
MSDTERKINGAIDPAAYDVDAGVSSDEFVGGGGRYSEPLKTGGEKPADEGLSLVFRELASPKLPDLPREARARLLMQSPTRLFFYWSVGANPYASLHKALGNGTSGYQLALRLLDLTNQTEELHSVEAEGSWWFNVRPESEFRAEIGFYSPSRPFVRILFSNTVETPRKGPSPHPASEARWIISPGKFAEVLDASGFYQDAFEVAADAKDSEFIAAAFAKRAEVSEIEAAGLGYDDLQTALRLLAEGYPLEDLKWKVSAELFALLQERYSYLGMEEFGRRFAPVSPEDEIREDELIETTAFGGSLINLRRPRFLRPRFAPVSSSNF